MPIRLIRSTVLFWICFAACLGLRIGVIVLRSDELRDDPDSYVGLAAGLAEGHGYSVPGSERPTAFRPPFYPLLITPFSGPAGHWGRGVLNLLAAAVTMWLIWRISQQLGVPGSAGVLAVLVYGLDPLMLRYSSMSMTETVCAMMSAVMLFRLTRSGQQTAGGFFFTGIAFGLTVLTRPTYWGWGGLLAAWSLLKQIRTREIASSRLYQPILSLVAGVGLVVSPWMIRNWIVLGWPILMTTHGGYTVLLGNNEAFYREVVDQRWGTVWDGSHGPGQAAWADRINQEMDELGLTTERERDRWMANRARQTITQHPVTFLKSCGIRFLRLWNVVPLGPAADGIPRFLVIAIGIAYSCLWILLAIGIFRICCDRDFCRNQWWPVLALVISFTLVHLVYWSNARMRAPIVPAIALLAGAAISPKSMKPSASSDVT